MLNDLKKLADSLFGDEAMKELDDMEDFPSRSPVIVEMVSPTYGDPNVQHEVWRPNPDFRLDNKVR